MNIRSHATDFSVFIFSQDVDLGARVRLALSEGKYESQLFADHDELIANLVDNPSHVVVLDIATLIKPVHEYIETILKISSEIKLIIFAPTDAVVALKKYRAYNVSFVLDRTDINLNETTLYAIDAVCEILYRTYQNEQLFEAVAQEQNKMSILLSEVSGERSSTSVRPYQLRISEYKTAQSKEHVLDIFYKHTPMQSWMYLKYVPSIQSFICVSYHEIPEAWVEGLSFKIPSKERGFHQALLQGTLPDSLNNYLLQKMNVKQLKFMPLILKEEIEGIMISPQEISADSAEDFSLMSLVYTNLAYESQPKFMDVEDNLTGFYNQLFYKRLLDKEVDRSKRASVALSLIKISIDKFRELEISQGRQVMDEIIKKVAEIIRRTSRLPDYMCRTAENEFSLVLINCNRKGAAIRSERLRQALHAEIFSKAGLKITTSQGISEYPTLTNSPEDLDQSALRALQFIAAKGGDKICIYKAAADHKPEFMVTS